MDSTTAKKIKSHGTKIEVLMGKALWKNGMRYRKNDKTVFGKPDFVFKSKKIAIFCDSEFWHGYNYLIKGERFKKNSDFLEKKILRNIERDKEVTQKLEDEGWTVFRFWGKQIEKNLDECVKQVKLIYDSTNNMTKEEAK
jgi:DNA mismatch endonuclease (patch repair protein)